MTAKGKINASAVNNTHRIIVNTNSGAYEGDSIRPSQTKTGEGVVIVRVLDKLKCSNRRGYMIVTSAGEFYAEPIQTMILAPEDNAGVKRAMVEAQAEDKRINRAATPAEVEAPAQAEVIRQAADAARQAPTAEAAAEIMAAATDLPAEVLASWVATNWEAPAADLAPAEAEALAATYNAGTGTQNAQAAHAAITLECPNVWHRTAPSRGLVLCPECPVPAAQAAGAAPARLAPARVLDLLPPLVHGRELVRLADLRELVPASLLTLHSQGGKVDNNSKDDLEEPEMTATTEIQPTDTATQEHTGSTVVALIERVWDRIRADHPELPMVVVTTGSGEGVKWGHFRPESWKLAESEGRLHEFFLASEALAKGAAQVLQTTIHEAAHTLSRVRGIKDTSRQGRWHNAAFKNAAEELGLEHKASKADSSHGFSFVTLTAATKVKYADLLEELDRELKLTGLLPIWMGGKDEEDERGGEKITKPKGGEDEGETKPKSGNLKATCGCEEPLIIRLSQKVLDLGVVRCDECEELFTAA